MRWLHLCDLHLGRSDDAQTIAMTKIVGAIEKAVRGTTIDLVLLAGDIANSGTDEDYDAAMSEVVVTHTHYMYGVATSGSGGGRSGDGCFAAARPFVWGLHT